MTLRWPAARTFRPRIPALLTGLVVLWSGWSAGWPGTRFRVWERSFENQLQQLRGSRRPPVDVVVVPVDDTTLQQGAWFEQSATIPGWATGISTLPWPRAAYGRVAEALLDAGARAVAINVVFEGNSRLGSSDDDALGRVLRAHPGRIALAAEMLEPSDSRGSAALTLVRPESLMAALGGNQALGLTNFLPILQDQPMAHPEAYGNGVLPAQGADGFPSLSATLLKLAGRSSRQDDPKTALNVYGPEGTFLRIPAWEVLDPARWRNHAKRGALRGSLAVVGPVVSQGDDGYPTPFGSVTGLELLATATANSLLGDGFRPWPDAPPLRALLAMAPLLLVSLVALARQGVGWRLSVTGMVLALQLLAGFLVMERAHRWLPILAPAAGLAVMALIYGGEAYVREERERRRLRSTFERYVAPGVVAEILSDPHAAQGILRGRVMPVTVLMSDLKGFTDLTRERTAKGESELHVRQLNAYLGAMVDVITEHGGTVDKFIGDAVMAVFGSPVSRGESEEAAAAVQCAVAMRQALSTLNDQWEQQGLSRLDNGVGLASGPVMVGQIGSPRRMEFTVIGDPVNLSARLEALTRRLDAGVIFDRRTADLLADGPSLPARALGAQEVKGMGAVEVFSLAR